MQIGVNAKFGFSEIFGGKLNFATQCQLQLANGYSLIYAEIEQLDVLKALNEAFNLDIGNASLIVDSAGFYTYLASAHAPSAPLSASFPNAPIPLSVASTSLPVADTASFWLTVKFEGDLGDKGLFRSILDINAVQGTQLSLSTTFSKGVAAGTAIKTAQYLIELNGTIELFNIIKFSKVSVSYCIAQSSQVKVSGDICIELFGSTFTFNGDVLSNSATQCVVANVAASGSATLPSLFGGAFPKISFTNICFNLFYPYRANTNAAKFMVRGACNFSGLDFVGLLYMEGTTPILGSVVFTRAASIQTLFHQCLPGASWPSDLFDLTLAQDSQAYYYEGTSPLTLTLSHDADGPTLLPVPTGQTHSSDLGPTDGTSPIAVTFEPGFNLSATFTLNLLETVNVNGTVVVNSNGVTASIELADPINIYVLQITRQLQPAAGPILAISTSGNTGTMRMVGALLFFQEDFGANATVTLGTVDGYLRAAAVLKPTRDYSPLLTTSDTLAFSYSKAQGFQISDWPAFNVVQDIVDFFSALKKLANRGTGCGQIGDFVSANLLGQHYSISPSFSSGSAGLTLSLSITCTLSVFSNSTSTQITQFTLPNAIEIAIPVSLSLDSLWPAIVSAVGNAADSFINVVLSNGSTVAALLVLFAGKQAVDYAATLICRGLANSLVESAVDAGAAAMAAGAAASAVLSAIFNANGGHGGGGGGSGGGGGGGGTAPGAPSNVLPGVNGLQVTSTWQLSGGAQSYCATLNGPEGQMASSGSLAYNVNRYAFGSIARPSTLPAIATINVTASNSNGTSPPGVASIEFLAAPTNLVAQPAPATPPLVDVQVSWHSDSADTGYVLTMTGPSERTMQSSSPSAVFSFSPLDPPGRYQLSVVATGNSLAIASPSSAPLSLTRLTAPVGLTGTATLIAIELKWDAVAEAASYAIAWTNPQGVCGNQSTPAGSGPTVSGIIDLRLPSGDGVWTVSVQAIAAQEPGLFIGGPPSDPIGVTVLPATTPEQLALACFAEQLNGASCSEHLIAVFTYLAPNSLALAMAIGGYGSDATGDGLHAAFPTITPGVMAAALAYAYPATPENFARARFDAGISGDACGQQLIDAFHDLTPNPLALAMAQGGYAANATGYGLHAAFPAITPAALAAALAHAYP